MSVDDGCEWDPRSQGHAMFGHSSHAQATVMVGSGKRMIRLCEACSRLPRFDRLRKRCPIESVQFFECAAAEDGES